MVGTAAAIRASSVTRPPSSGTLKSTRARTACPVVTSRSRTVLLPNTSGHGRAGENALGKVDHPIRIAPLVVVPGDDLHELLVDHHRERRVEDRGVRRRDDVARD